MTSKPDEYAGGGGGKEEHYEGGERRWSWLRGIPGAENGRRPQTQKTPLGGGHKEASNLGI